MDWIARGGVLMIPIIFLSVVAVGVFLERLWVLRTNHVVPESVLKEIELLLRQKRIQEARAFCKNKDCPVTRILQGGLMHYGSERALIREGIEERGKAEALELKKYIPLVQTIASLSPLLGLLGTVNGMIKVFDSISVTGPGTHATLAIGISEALITTATGLTVAIPAALGQRYLAGKAERLIHQLEEYGSYMLNLLSGVWPGMENPEP